MKSLLAAMSVHLPTIVFRRTGRKHNQTTSRATNIDTSVIQKPDIFAVQHKDVAYLNSVAMPC